MKNTKMKKAFMALLAGSLVLANAAVGFGASASAGVEPSTEEMPLETEAALAEETEAGDGAVFNETEAVGPGFTETEALEPESETAEDTELKRIRFAADKQELYDVISSFDDSWYWIDDVDYMVEEAAVDTVGTVSNTSAMKADAASPAAAAPDYSDVNVRQEGVDEADVIRTDGKYIYILCSDHTLYIVEPGSDGLKEAACIDLPRESGNYQSEEIFLGKNCVQVIACRDYYDRDAADGMSYIQETFLYTYDLTDIENPVLAGTYRQDGYYQEARKKDGKIYLFTRWTPLVNTSCESSVLTPSVCGEEMDPTSVCIPETMTSREYMVISALDEKEPSVCTDAKALVSGSDLNYVSLENIYVLNRDWNSDKTSTEITKFSYADGRIDPVAAGRVRGTVKDSFCIDEYNGYLRVLTTYRGSADTTIMEALSNLFGFYYDDPDRFVDHNALYILDEKMVRAGRLKDLAEGETMRSARFFGDIAYFVTFRNTDPLFTADLSDPAAPKIIGELEIPGFSGYLHPFGENKLLGVGYTADVLTGATTGIKLSLYDISDPVNVKESDITTINGITYLPALDDYRAFLVNADRGLIGFYLNDRYFVYTLKPEGGFERSLIYDLYEDDLQDNYGYEEIRGLFIADEFYLAGPAFVTAFDMENGYAKDNVLKFGKVEIGE